MPTNLIVNGTFNSGSTGWSGTDLETSYRESAYLGNGSSNRVAEMDGRSGQVTVMEQSFAVTGNGEVSATFNIDSALRTASLGQAGQEGFTVEILDSSGGIVGSMTILPTVNSFSTYSMDVLFPSSGTYTLRMTELGPNNSLGAIIDNVELMVCFCNGTMISTPGGPRPVESLRVGETILTQQGPDVLRWIGKRHVSATDRASNPSLHPVRISAGALGAGLPARDLRVSRQHRMLCSNRIVSTMFNEPSVLVAAIRLVGLPGVSLDEIPKAVTYYHLALHRHQVIYAEGAPTESFRITRNSLASLSSDGRKELFALFPDLQGPAFAPLPDAVVIPPRARQKSLIRRMAKNRKPLLSMAV
ncbi:Hint domain-containing protein [Aliisedimentitalea scapharcae]|uniref:Hint domain-containing protein n=1 Tax=Aliisedimentitalea scapharcae TaxID=1524259 RepID=A0ABZ2XSN7_9RHOB